MKEPIEITPEELEQITTFWDITALTAKRNLLVIKNNLHQESGTQNELLQEVRNHAARSQELLEGIHTSLKEFSVAPSIPKGFVKATIYGVLPERESHVGICLLTENNEKLRFFVTKQDIKMMLSASEGYESAIQISHLEGQIRPSQCR